MLPAIVVTIIVESRTFADREHAEEWSAEAGITRGALAEGQGAIHVEVGLDEERKVKTPEDLMIIFKNTLFEAIDRTLESLKRDHQWPIELAFENRGTVQ